MYDFFRTFVVIFYTVTEDNVPAVIGLYLLIIIAVNNIENVVIKYKQYTTHFYSLLAPQTTWDVGTTLGKLVNHSPLARDLQSLLVFFQHRAWFIE